MLGVFTFTVTHFLPKLFFPEGMGGGGVQNSSRNSGGVGGGLF